MRPSTLNLTGWLYRPYIDLTPEAPDGNPHVAGLMLAIEALKTGVTERRLHGVFSDGLRSAIVKKAIKPEYDVIEPSGLHRSLRTPEWELLADSIDRFVLLAADEQARVLWLLFKLNMHRLVVHLASYLNDDEPQFEALTICGLSKFALDADDVSTLRYVAEHAEVGSWEGIEATYVLAARAGKFKRDLPELEKWLRDHESQITHSQGRFVSKQAAQSRFYRVGAFLPMLKQDHAEMTETMSMAQYWAEQIPRESFAENAEACTVLSALWESRAKEARLLGDAQLQTKYADNYTQVAPLSPLSHFALANALQNQGEWKLATHEFKLAARYGPPKDAEALWMAGSCTLEHGSAVAAGGLFLQAADLELLTMGEISPSSREAIGTVGDRTDNMVLAGWAVDGEA